MRVFRQAARQGVAAAMAAALLAPGATLAQDQSDDDSAKAAIVADIVETHILPRVDDLAETSADLAATAQQDCTPDDRLKAAWATAYDAWINASHLAFGPVEQDSRGFALSFWPDTRGMIGKALTPLIQSADPMIEDEQTFAGASVAVRGFTAMEEMLYDPEILTTGGEEYRCKLTRAMATDIAATAQAIADDWDGRYADLMMNAGENDSYRTVEEALQELYKALYTGLEYDADTRLGQPLGSADKPRPERAEARLSRRSQHNIELSLASLQDLADKLVRPLPGRQGLADEIDAAFDRAEESAARLDDPDLSGVADSTKRFRLESLQFAIRQTRDLVRGELGPALGVQEGFNALDGD